MQIIKKLIPHVNTRILSDEINEQINKKYKLSITKKQFDDIVDKYMVGEYGFYPTLNAFIRNLLLDKNFFEMCDEDYRTTIREIFVSRRTLSNLNTMVNNIIYEKYYNKNATAEV